MYSSSQYEMDELPSVGIWKWLKGNPFLSRFADLLTPPDPVIVTRRGRRRIPKLLRNMGSAEKGLNVGSGTNTYSESVINLDRFPVANVHVVAEAAFLPFKNASFTVVISQAVLEHVKNPTQAVNEMHRVLTRKGVVYAEIPFFQGFHATPTYPDFQRYTLSGIQSLFRQFELLKKGVLAGPGSALAWTLREFLAILFSCNSTCLYRTLNLIFGWLTMPLKYFDYFLETNRFASVIASGFFFLGRKT